MIVQKELPISSSTSAELPGAALEEVRSALAELASRSTDATALRAAVCTLAREARDRSVAPERLLVSFKRTWGAELAANPMPDRHSQAVLLDEMVSLCIREYFA